MFHSKHQLDQYTSDVVRTTKKSKLEIGSDRQHNHDFDHALLYVVQKCPHPTGSGPAQDMLRLFHSQKEAEEAAYLSAKAFGSKVKTLMLPSYPALNPQGSSYGFLSSYGDLFWVRALRATIVGAANSDDAYAIFTRGVIGGLGSQCRGTEVSNGRVFVGDARAIAMGVFHKVALSHPTLQVEAKMVAVGKKAEEWYSSGAFLRDWPLGVFLTTTNMHSMKRDGCDSDVGNTIHNNSMSHNSSSDNEAFAVVDCPFEQPVTKKRRLFEEQFSMIPREESSCHDSYDYFGVKSAVGELHGHDEMTMQ